MNRAIMTVISIIVIEGLILTSGCGEKVPKMTAPEVCQYVNQALEVEHVNRIGQRDEYRYSAISAKHIEKGSWEVTVKVNKETLWYRDGQWVTLPFYYPTEEYTEQYYFSENTGALTKK